MGFHKENQKTLPDTIDMGPEQLKVKTFFRNKTLTQQVLYEIRERETEYVICHNIYHHFPITELFQNIKKYNKTTLVLYLHDYKVVCPTYNLFHNKALCEKCANKRFYFCALNRCKDNSLIKSSFLSLESYYNNSFHDAYKYADVIISPSHFLKDKVLEMGFRHKIYTLYHPLRYEPPLENNPKRKDNLLFVGRLSEEKRIHLLIELAKRLYDIEIHIIGDGPLKPFLLKRIQKLANITYFGYQQQDFICKAMETSKYLIIPSMWPEVYGMVILEAMSVGLPVIGASRGGIPELIGKKRGICFEPDNIRETIEIIRRMMQLPLADYNLLSKEAITFAREKNYSSYYNHLAEILNSASG